jgi:ABC-type phosphate/phosphonate transport system substrate-binding protein
VNPWFDVCFLRRFGAIMNKRKTQKMAEIVRSGFPGRSAAAVLFMVVIVTMLLTAPAAGTQGKKAYRIGVYATTVSQGMAGQAEKIFTDLSKILQKREGVSFDLKTFTDIRKFKKEIEGKKIDFAYSFDGTVFYDLVKKYQYTPFLTASTFQQSIGQSCIYVRKNNAYNHVSDLKSKTISMSRYPQAFFTLRRLTGTNPMDHFQKIQFQNNVQSGFYSLSLGQVDATLADPSNFQLMKKNNPGPVKDVMELICDKAFYLMPLLYAKTVPNELVSHIVDMSLNMRKDKDFKTYWPLMRSVELKMLKVTAADYADFFKSIEEARRKGWDKEYQFLLNQNE